MAYFLRQQMKLLILVVSSEGLPYVYLKKVWRLYMKSHPNIDCYFLQSDPCLKTDVELRDDTLWIKLQETLGNVYEKTLRGFDFFKDMQYDFICRTTVSSFVVFDRYFKYCETLPVKKHISAVINYNVPGIIYPSGAFFTMSKDLMLELIMDRPILTMYDDITIGIWLKSKNIEIQSSVWYDHIPNQNMCIPDDVFHIRIKHVQDRNLDIAIHKELALKFYNKRITDD